MTCRVSEPPSILNPKSYSPKQKPKQAKAWSKLKILQITHLLLSAGARTDLRNGRGRVAADLAMEVQQGETVGDAA